MRRSPRQPVGFYRKNPGLAACPGVCRRSLPVPGAPRASLWMLSAGCRVLLAGCWVLGPLARLLRVSKLGSQPGHSALSPSPSALSSTNHLAGSRPYLALSLTHTQDSALSTDHSAVCTRSLLVLWAGCWVLWAGFLRVSALRPQESAYRT